MDPPEGEVSKLLRFFFFFFLADGIFVDIIFAKSPLRVSSERAEKISLCLLFDFYGKMNGIPNSNPVFFPELAVNFQSRIKPASQGSHFLQPVV